LRGRRRTDQKELGNLHFLYDKQISVESDNFSVSLERRRGDLADFETANIELIGIPDGRSW